jgi:hypothetical protein
MVDFVPAGTSPSGCVALLVRARFPAFRKIPPCFLRAGEKQATTLESQDKLSHKMPEQGSFFA